MASCAVIKVRLFLIITIITRASRNAMTMIYCLEGLERMWKKLGSASLDMKKACFKMAKTSARVASVLLLRNPSQQHMSSNLERHIGNQRGSRQHGILGSKQWDPDPLYRSIRTGREQRPKTSARLAKACWAQPPTEIRSLNIRTDMFVIVTNTNRAHCTPGYQASRSQPTRCCDFREN
ncbi:hypothetical protein LX32DRAFT_57297 [Colletotrichum zoysiae]|uniref:Secreted protein n=1 Tax=Colletotrichum zoysiae TaxID=1216348 RepID=A0AAD9HSP6_9PEZI|nr:hypothetical protein LX32DRAFT_57297 [Colletotrichum zoysiae]